MTAGVNSIVLFSLAVALTACSADPGSPPAPAAADSNADPAHNSRSSLDWAGTYLGVLPCADCEGIETVISLTEDGSFREHTRYLGRAEGQTEYSRNGSFDWSTDGSTVTLAGNPPHPYRVGENRLTRLAQDGSPVTGALAENYVLARATPQITGWRWTLVELRGQPVTGLEPAPFLVLNAAENRTTGFGGCNSLSGGFVLDASTLQLRFERMVSTLRACVTGMETEQALHQVLQMVDNYSLSGDQLSLNRARMAPLARFVASFPE